MTSRTHQKIEKDLAEKQRGTAAAEDTDGMLYDADGKPVIRLEDGNLVATTDATEKALGKVQNMFVYADQLALIHQTESHDGEVRRAAGAVMIRPVQAPLLTYLAGQVATFERYDPRSGGYRRCDCPRKIPDVLLARGPHFPHHRVLNGFIEVPTVTAGGRIIDQPGYDAETGLFLAAADLPGYRRPRQKPLAAEAKKALTFITSMFATFPFVSDADRAAMVAGVITSMIRRLLPAAPLFAITAPTPGTGKTLLCETLAILATARRACVLSLGHDDAETEKRLAGVLLAGDAVISIDNIERPLKGDLLCQVTTQQFLRLRPLGGSGMLNVPTHALLVATGNNLAIVGDLKRRVVLIRLDAGTERPEQRDFNDDHLALIAARRGEIVSAALTIVLAYLNAGSPKIEGIHPLGGFELWDRMVRRPLVWLGMPDPMIAAEGLRDADPDIEAMRLLYSSWHDKFKSAPVTVADVVAAGMQTAPMSGDYLNPDLRDSLQLVCAEKPNSRRLGGWLRRHQDRIVDGMTVRQAGSDSHSKVARWSVVACG